MEADHQPGTIDFAMSLDDPQIEPSFHIFYASRIRWFVTADRLPRHDGFRANTRGLEGTEPPNA